MRFRGSKTFRSPILILAIVASALFFLGPQMASLDTDDDSSNDIPVAILSSASVVRPSNFASESQSSDTVRPPTVLALTVPPNYFENDSPAGRDALKSFCLLRC